MCLALEHTHLHGHTLVHEALYNLLVLLWRCRYIKLLSKWFYFACTDVDVSSCTEGGQDQSKQVKEHAGCVLVIILSVLLDHCVLLPMWKTLPFFSVCACFPTCLPTFARTYIYFTCRCFCCGVNSLVPILPLSASSLIMPFYFSSCTCLSGLHQCMLLTSAASFNRRQYFYRPA